VDKERSRRDPDVVRLVEAATGLLDVVREVGCIKLKAPKTADTAWGEAKNKVAAALAPFSVQPEGEG
jgi:hypothetical protein